MSGRNLRIRIEIQSEDGMAFCDGEIDRALVEMVDWSFPHKVPVWIADEMHAWSEGVARRWVEETRKIKREKP